MYSLKRKAKGTRNRTLLVSQKPFLYLIPFSFGGLVTIMSDSLDLMDYSLQGSSVPGISQARILEWVVIPSLGDIPNPGIEPGSPMLQVDFLPSEPPGKPNL